MFRGGCCVTWLGPCLFDSRFDSLSGGRHPRCPTGWHPCCSMEGAVPTGSGHAFSVHVPTVCLVVGNRVVPCRVLCHLAWSTHSRFMFFGFDFVGCSSLRCPMGWHPRCPMEGVVSPGSGHAFSIHVLIVCLVVGIRGVPCKVLCHLAWSSLSRFMFFGLLVARVCVVPWDGIRVVPWRVLCHLARATPFRFTCL